MGPPSPNRVRPRGGGCDRSDAEPVRQSRYNPGGRLTSVRSSFLGVPLREFGHAVAQLGREQLFIRAGRPQTNGSVERVQILEKCWKPAFARHLIPKQTGLRRDLERYLRYHNTAPHGPPHQGRTSETVIGKAKIWAR